MTVIDVATPRPARRKSAPKNRARRLIAIGGGKGGIGKSLISASLGLALAQRGNKVVLVDADLGGANLHTCLGVAQPEHSLSDFIDRRVETLEQLVVSTGFARLGLISGASDGLDAANPKHSQKQRLIRSLRSLDVDDVVIDLGAGTSYNVIDFFLASDVGIVVMLPEPTSIENAYRFIKAAFYRKMQTAAPKEDFAKLVGEALSPKMGSASKTPWDVVEQLRETDAAKASLLEQALRGFRPHLVINQARTRADFDIGPSIAHAWKKFFGLELGYLGIVNHDEAVVQSVKNRKPLLGSLPHGPAAMSLLRVAENLIALDR
jgi:flagellar biosynthesis protein FlhG